ncbi:MAG: hypothetical protein WD070_08175, partial [Pirellulaceae bacterium]
MSHPIQRQIHAIARRARRLLLVHALCWFVIVVVSVGFALGWIDYSLRLQDRGVRVILSILFGLSLVASLRRFIIPSLRRHFGELEVAQQVERRFPQLGDRLSSSLEFLRRDATAGRAESARLQQTVISETEALVQPLDLQDCLDPRATRRSLLACVPLLLAVGIICGLDLDATSLAARRLAAPWSRESWPRWNSLEIEKAPQRIARGQDFVVEVTDARDRLPEHATLQFRFEGDEESEVETAAMQRVDDHFTYSRGNVTRSFQYRAVGGDDDSMPWHTLQVVEPVRITDLRATVQPPAYSGLAATEVPAGPIRILADSQLTLSGRVDRPVQDVRGHISVGDATETGAAKIADNGNAFTISSLPTDSPGQGQYWIEATEADGVVSGSDARATWEVVADQAPTVSVSAPTTEMYFTPNASIPLRVTATDDLAIHHVRLQIGATTILLFEGAEVPAARDGLPAHPDVREITRELNLGEFRLAPSDSLELVFHATDYKPQTSEPTTRTITIISQEDFDYRSQERQKQLLGRLVEALRLQRATRSQIESLRTQLNTVGGLSDRDASELRSTELQQQQVARVLGESPGGAAQLVAELIDALHSNQMAESEAAARMERLAESLNLVNRERLPTLQSEFVRATKTARIASDEGDAIDSLLTSIGGRQETIAAELQSMIDQLSQWDDYRRFARDVANLLRDQQDISSRVGQLPTFGQRFDALSAQQRADLERLAGEQLDVAQRLNRLQAEMDKLRDKIRESDPSAAATLAEALREAAANGIAERMREIGNDVARNRLGNASQAQGEVERGLQQILGALTESSSGGEQQQNDPSRQQLAAVLEQLKAQLADLASRQQLLLDATSAWQDAGTSPLTQQQMVREQRQLADDTKDAGEPSSLPKAFAFGMTAVEAEMNQAAERLEREAPDGGVQRLQRRALSRLQQLLTALSSQAAREEGEPSRNDSASGGDESTAGSPSDGQSALSVEELRLLVAMQSELYQRTLALEKQRQQSETLEDEAEQELQQLAAEQGRLAELLSESLPA